MTTNLAADYADSIAATFWDNDRAGAPLGYVSDHGDLIDAGEYDALPEEERDEYHEASGMDYICDALGYEYRVGAGRTYKSAEVLITFGGPNAHIDTDRRCLVVAWGGDTATRGLPSSAIEMIDDAMCEMWEMDA